MRPLRRQSRTEEVYVPPEKRNTYLPEDEVVSAKTFSIEEVINLQELANDKERADSLKKTDAKLEKVEIKTEKLLDKAKSLELKKASQIVVNSSSGGTTIIVESTTSGNKKRNPATKKRPSLFEFLCLKGIPRAVGKHIAQNMFFSEDTGKFLCVIDSDEINKACDKTASQDVANAIYRMQASGWFKTIRHSNNGTRLVEISNPEFYRDQK